MGKAGVEEVRLAAQPTERKPEFIGDLPEFVTAEIAQGDALEVAPDAFGGIELRRVGRQPFEVQPRGGASGEKVLDRLAAMNGRAVPEDEQFARHVLEQVLQKTHDRRPVHGVGLLADEQPPVGGHSANGRQMVARQGDGEHRCLAARRISADHTRQQIEGGLVYPDERTLLALGFFLSAGQRSVCHWAIAASSRWLARRVGFWRVQPSWASSVGT